MGKRYDYVMVSEIDLAGEIGTNLWYVIIECGEMLVFLMFNLDHISNPMVFFTTSPVKYLSADSS